MDTPLACSTPYAAVRVTRGTNVPANLGITRDMLLQLVVDPSLDER